MAEESAFNRAFGGILGAFAGLGTVFGCLGLGVVTIVGGTFFVCCILPAIADSL